MHNPVEAEYSQQQLAGWLELSDGVSLFHWLHKPVPCSSLAVVISGPIGPEYMHCKRAIKQLAEKLAEYNIATVRFDPVGYGNSSGSVFDPQLARQWNDSLCEVVFKLKMQAGIKQIGLVALRSASLLGTELLSSNSSIDYLVYWYPYSQGAAFKRDMEMIDQLLDTSSEDSAGYINAGGYPLTHDTANSLNHQKLKDVVYQVKQALIISSSDSAGNARIVNQISKHGIACDEQTFDSLPKMAKQAELSELPDKDIEAITRWLLARDDQIQNKIEFTHLPLSTLECVEYTESIVDSKTGPHLFGIFCKPASDQADRGYYPLIVLTNGGAGHHVGPNRLYVDLARTLAKAGFQSLRFDLSNLGDSPQFKDKGNNSPYPDNALDDIDRMLTEIGQLSANNRYIITGLCSGASNAFHAQHELVDHEIDETILINPLTFYLQAGESVIEPEASKTAIQGNYYGSQARDWRTWLSLFYNPRKIFRVLSFIWRYLAEKSGSGFGRVAIKLGLMQSPLLHRDIKAILQRGKKISFFISENDPGYDMIMRDAGPIIQDNLGSGNITIKRLSGVDHTFSTLSSRESLIDSICKHLENRYRRKK